MLIFFVALLFLTILVIKRFLYFQPSNIFIPVTEKYQDIYEGNIHAWYKAGKTKKIILFCHGNAGNISYRQEKLSNLLKLGFSVIIFDYSGFGYSKGTPNENICYSNAETIFTYLLRNNYSKSDIIPYGESLGAPIASYIARKYNLPLLIIESGLPSIQKLIVSKSYYLYPFSLFFPEFNTIKYIDGYKGKILVLHSEQDEIIPFSTTEEIRKLATKTIIINGTHNYPEIPWTEIKDFIDKHYLVNGSNARS
jgi:pimeloyl-ACP methyl ester carboxylesterase